MKRYPVTVRLGGLLAALALSGCAPTEDQRPANVVVILIDDMGWMDTSVYGSSFYDTPNIDRLAAEGVQFTQFYTASSVCSPTRASIMTGKHPARLDLTNWIGGEQNGLLDQAQYIRRLPQEEVTIGEAFQAAGYTTGYVGKWHLGEEGHLPVSQGFEFNFAVNHAGQPGSYFPPYSNSNMPATDVPDLAGDSSDAYLTDRLTDASLAFIESSQADPFLLVLSHYAVHTPLEAPAEVVGRYQAKADALGPEGEEHYESERAADTKLRQDHPTYAAMVESTDQSVGRILEKLDELDLDERTVVVFLSDNGGLSTLTRRSFNQATANVPLRAGKGWLYEGGIRVPFIVRWPGKVPAGRSVSTPAMSTDLFPTLLELANLPTLPAQHVDGVSLAELIAGGREGEAHDALFWHFPHYHGSGNRPGGAARIGDLKLVEWFEDGALELYDLSSDLGERRDLASERPDDVARLSSALHQWRDDLDANMPTTR
ncbi:MAG: sulfatase [Longimicrobiales bacterium]